LRSLGWAQFFIKDYVKSLKTSRGSIISDPPKIRSLLAEMQRVRGEIEGGLCVRQVEDFMPESERRYFVLNGRAYSADNSEIPATVREVAGKIPSPFFSIDAIVRRDHVMRIVEIGDGQVSDLTGWTPLQFAGIWRRSQQT
jgi:hypothetical protein